jgi:hypothetical protein
MAGQTGLADLGLAAAERRRAIDAPGPRLR